MRTRRAKALIGAGAGLGIVAAASSVAQAAIPGPGGVIYACYDKNTGNVRIYDVAKTSCKTSEVRITWNQVGPMGPMGPRGYTGATGATGPKGATGATGA
ncbi:MAG: hypothetical protein ACXVYH_18395, partial [Oryzihumus sp.]